MEETTVKKAKQSHLATRAEIRDKYLQELEEYSQVVSQDVQVWWQEKPLTIACWKLSDSCLPKGCFKSTSGMEEPKYQINYTDPEASSKKRTKPRAYRMPFVLDPNFTDPSYSVSHMCHNNWCHNPQHVVLEQLDVNKARNGCPAGPHCHHKVQCLIPGKYYNC